MLEYLGVTFDMPSAYTGQVPKEKVILKLKDIREKRMMTQLDLAMKSGVTPAQISRLENHPSNPRVSTLKRLAAALGVEPQELFVRD